MSILYFLVVLLLLVLAHEFGHYTAARWFKIKVYEFGFCFPPRIFGWRKKTDAKGKRKTEWIVGNRQISENDHTLFSLNLLPLGGFVKIKGQAEEEPGEDSFSQATAGARALVLAGGVAMNVLVGFLIFVSIFLIGAPTYLPEGTAVDGTNIKKQEIKIVSVLPNSPAATAGIRHNDTIISIDDARFATVDAIRTYISQHDAVPLTFTVYRAGESIPITVTPQRNATSEARAIVGIGMAQFGTIHYSFLEAIGRAAQTTVTNLGQIFNGMFGLLGNLIQGQSVRNAVSGPLGIVVMTGEAASLGLVYFLQFTALLSLNLAVINLLPIPALDGGHLLFVLIEKIRGKKGNLRLQQTTSMIGMMTLLLLILAITVNDITNRWGDVFQKIKGVF